MSKNWCLCILIVLLTSCNSAPAQTPSPAPENFPSATAMVVEDVLPTVTQAASPIPEAATVIPATEGKFQPSAILARMYPGSFLLLGGTENGEWLSAEMVAPSLLDGEIYNTYDMNGPVGSTKGKAPQQNFLCETYYVETDSYPMGGQEIGVTGNWDVIPRLAQEIPADQEAYVEIVKNWLIGQNIPEPVVAINHVLRVDIEGDGTEEVLISASHFVEPTGHSVVPGDYSLVLMRKVVGNSVETIPLLADYYYEQVEIQFPLTYTSIFLADLNGDNHLEVLVGVERWEGNGVIVFSVDETNVQTEFNIFCGL